MIFGICKTLNVLIFVGLNLGPVSWSKSGPRLVRNGLNWSEKYLDQFGPTLDQFLMKSGQPEPIDIQEV